MNIFDVFCYGFVLIAIVVLFLCLLTKALDKHQDFLEERLKLKIETAWPISVILVCLELAAAFYLASLFVRGSV